MAAPIEFEFPTACLAFQDVAKHAVEHSDMAPCFSLVESYCGNDQEKRAALDQAMRDVLRHMIVFNKGCPVYKQAVGLAVEAVIKDVFDMLILEDCEDMFDFVEDRVSTWKSDPFFDAGKNYLLRMCNDLIRRLSKSQNTVFCGRIQLFLSRLFPLSEKSALNLMSQFNLENITVFASESNDLKAAGAVVKGEKMDLEDGETEETLPILIDYNLYRKFWSLQDYFRKPTQCYDKMAWRAFTMYSDEVLGTFSSCKLDDLLSQRKKLHRKDDQSHNFFAKYLTSEKLLDLQLSDSNFRRYVLVQFLILFQYLTSTVRFKSATQVLSDDQLQWVKTSEERVYQLIRETPPSGDKFADTVKHILQREDNWNNWKNEGCPTFERERPKETQKPKNRPKRRRIGEDLQTSGGKIIKMGSNELTRLWNLNPDNMDACRSEKREFMPTLEEFFANAIEQNDPEAMVEEQYNVIQMGFRFCIHIKTLLDEYTVVDINNSNFQWKALRLLARRSPHFFLHTNQPAIPLPSYLELMISKIAKEMPANGTEEMKTEVGEEEEEDMKESHEEEDNSEEHEQNKDDANDVITTEQMTAVAKLLGENWKKLASELGFSGEDIADFEEMPDEKTGLPAAKMIFLWQDADQENRALALKMTLKEIGQYSIAETVFGSAS